jgi:hypothetical protein
LDASYSPRTGRGTSKHLLKEAIKQVFDTLLPGVVNHFDAAHLANLWFKGSEERERVKGELQKYGLDPESVVSQAYVLRCDELDKMERMLTTAELRRIGVTRAFREHRAAAALRYSQVIESEQVTLIPGK